MDERGWQNERRGKQQDVTHYLAPAACPNVFFRFAHARQTLLVRSIAAIVCTHSTASVLTRQRKARADVPNLKGWRALGGCVTDHLKIEEEARRSLVDTPPPDQT